MDTEKNIHKRTAYKKQEDVDQIEDEISVDSEGDVIVPDGGWGWVIVLASFMCIFIIDGVIQTFGMIYIDLLDYYKTDAKTTSLAGSLISGVYLSVGVVAGSLINCYGCRPVAFAGGIVACSGILLSSFCTHIYTFLLTYGIIGGIGYGFMYLPSVLIVNMYFEKKRALVSSIVTSGSGIGMFAFASLSKYLLEVYNWKGALIICAGITLHACAFASLMRPLMIYKSPSVEPEEPAREITAVEVENRGGSIDNARKIPKLHLPSDKREIVNQCSFVDNRQFLSQASNKFPLMPVPAQLHMDSGSLSVFDATALSYRSYLFRNVHMMSMENNILNSTVSLPTNSLTSIGPHGALFHSMGCLKAVSKPPNPRIRRRNRRMRSVNPFLRKDIFFSGSIHHLKEYYSQSVIKQFVPTSPPEDFTCIEEGDSEQHVPISFLKHYLALLQNYLMGYRVLLNMHFILLCLGAVMIQISHNIPIFFIGDYGVAVGLQKEDSSVFISIIGIFNTLGRLSAGVLTNYCRMKPLAVNVLSLFFCGVSCFFIPLCHSYLTITFFSGAFGYFIGFFPPLQSLILVEYLGLENLTTSFGFMTMMKGLATIAGPPLAGAIYDRSGNYTSAILFAGGILIISVLLHLLMFCGKHGITKEEPIIDIHIESDAHHKDVTNHLLEDHQQQ